MKILLCNPRNSQGTKHSRKGMYPPLGILSICSYLEEHLGDALDVDMWDEDVEELNVRVFSGYDLIGFYATTFNYGQAVRYAYFAKDLGCITVLGGPHPTVLAKNIIQRRHCFDYIIRYEAEYPFLNLLQYLLGTGKGINPSDIPNLAFKDHDGRIIINDNIHVNSLPDLPVPSRVPAKIDLYTENFRKIYADKADIIPGSIYSSKGCSWRDRTGGCIFCARLEEGVRFRDINQIWSEIAMLKDQYGVNSIWDIADDNLNNRDWFIKFVNSRPKSCQDIKFFIYSRAGCIKEWVMEYFHELNVEEVFLGIESGDNRLLREAFKGQTREQSYRAMKLLKDNNIKYYPSFVLGLPGESVASLNNTLSLCQELADLGGLDRMSATILKPIPGSNAYNRVLGQTSFGKDLSLMDDIDLGLLEKYWIFKFTAVSYEIIEDYKNKIDELMSDYQVFGSSVEDEN